jgi:hypothetical protein
VPTPALSRRSLLAAFLAAALALALFPPSTSASAQEAVGAPVTISQVYGGGGNSGAPFNRDYVELFNRTDAPIELSGRSVQYTSATGSGNFGANDGLRVSLTGTIAPGRYHLVALASGSNGTNLPEPDDSGTINASAASGKFVLAGTARPHHRPGRLRQRELLRGQRPRTGAEQHHGRTAPGRRRAGHRRQRGRLRRR